MEQIIEELRAIRGDIGALREDMNRYRGFVAGMTWCFTGLVGFVGLVWSFWVDGK
jgi:hypothetical protein